MHEQPVFSAVLPQSNPDTGSDLSQANPAKQQRYPLVHHWWASQPSQKSARQKKNEYAVTTPFRPERPRLSCFALRRRARGVCDGPFFIRRWFALLVAFAFAFLITRRPKRVEFRCVKNNKSADTKLKARCQVVLRKHALRMHAWRASIWAIFVRLINATIRN
jgi:hypothetical protein